MKPIKFKSRRLPALAIVLALGWSLTLPPGTALSAAPDQPGAAADRPVPEPDPLIANQAGHRLNEQEVAAVRKMYDIDDRTARLHLALSDRSEGIASLAQARWPDEYAGYYHVPRQAQVVILFTSDAAHRVEELRGSFYNPHALVGRDAEWSLRQLEDARTAIWNRRAEFDQRWGLWAVNIDQPRNIIVVSAERPTPDAADALRAEYGVPIEVETVEAMRELSIPPVSNTCEYTWVSCNPLRGSAGLSAISNDMWTTHCTIGFNAYNNLDNNRRILTAGHCPNLLYHSNALVGSGTYIEANDTTVDAQSMVVDPGWSTSNALIHVSSSGSVNQMYRIWSVYTGTNLGTNATICVSGGRSRTTTCGAVKNGMWSGTLSGTPHVGMLEFTGCSAEPGDSGAPVYASNTAYGIVAGGNISTCSVVASYIKWVQDRMQARVRTTN